MSAYDPKRTFSRLNKGDQSARNVPQFMAYFPSTKGGGTIHSSDTDQNRGGVFNRLNPVRRRRGRQRILFCLLASAIIALTSDDAVSAAGHKQLTSHRGKGDKAERHKHRPVKDADRGERAPGPRTILPDITGRSTGTPVLSPELLGLKQALQLVQQRRFTDAAVFETSLGDPTAQKLVRWALLRNSDNPAGFDDYNSFIQANPDWPSLPLMRRRAEARLWQERRDAATVWRLRVHRSRRAIVLALHVRSALYGIRQNCQPS
jgi:hypothetical protein